MVLPETSRKKKQAKTTITKYSHPHEVINMTQAAHFYGIAVPPECFALLEGKVILGRGINRQVAGPSSRTQPSLLNETKESAASGGSSQGSDTLVEVKHFKPELDVGAANSSPEEGGAALPSPVVAPHSLLGSPPSKPVGDGAASPQGGVAYSLRAVAAAYR